MVRRITAYYRLAVSTEAKQELHSSIAYSSMSSGQWKIIISGANVAVQRTINLAIGAPSTVTVTVSNTIYKSRRRVANVILPVGYSNCDRGNHEHTKGDESVLQVHSYNARNHK